MQHENFKGGGRFGVGEREKAKMPSMERGGCYRKRLCPHPECAAAGRR